MRVNLICKCATFLGIHNLFTIVRSPKQHTFSYGLIRTVYSVLPRYRRWNCPQRPEPLSQVVGEGEEEQTKVDAEFQAAEKR